MSLALLELIDACKLRSDNGLKTVRRILKDEPVMDFSGKIPGGNVTLYQLASSNANFQISSLLLSHQKANAVVTPPGLVPSEDMLRLFDACADDDKRSIALEILNKQPRNLDINHRFAQHGGMTVLHKTIMSQTGIYFDIMDYPGIDQEPLDANGRTPIEVLTHNIDTHPDDPEMQHIKHSLKVAVATDVFQRETKTEKKKRKALEKMMEALYDQLEPVKIWVLGMQAMQEDVKEGIKKRDAVGFNQKFDVLMQGCQDLDEKIDALIEISRSTFGCESEKVEIAKQAKTLEIAMQFNQLNEFYGSISASITKMDIKDLCQLVKSE